MCEGKKAVAVGLAYTCRIFFLLCLNLQHNKSISLQCMKEEDSLGTWWEHCVAKKGPQSCL